MLQVSPGGGAALCRGPDLSPGLISASRFTTCICFCICKVLMGARSNIPFKLAEAHLHPQRGFIVKLRAFRHSWARCQQPPHSSSRRWPCSTVVTVGPRGARASAGVTDSLETAPPSSSSAKVPSVILIGPVGHMTGLTNHLVQGMQYSHGPEMDRVSPLKSAGEDSTHPQSQRLGVGEAAPQTTSSGTGPGQRLPMACCLVLGLRAAPPHAQPARREMSDKALPAAGRGEEADGPSSHISDTGRWTACG